MATQKTIYFLSENNFKVSGIDVSDAVDQIDKDISLVSFNIWFG